MPLYQFRCKKCLYEFEEVQGINDPPLMFCPHCRGELERLFFDWDEKLERFRKYNRIVDSAPIFPYFFTTYLIILLITGVLGTIFYQSTTAFLGVVFFTIVISLISLVGIFPVIGPFLYAIWLAPWFCTYFIYHFEMKLGTLTGLIYWIGFAFSVLFTLFTSLYVVYRMKTPLLWCFLDEKSREKISYLLSSRLLNYETSPIWIKPESWLARVLKIAFNIVELPSIRLYGKNYYYQDIPIKPMKILLERKNITLT